MESNTARFLLLARQRGIDFGSVLTIGRQNFFLTQADLARLGREFSFDPATLAQKHSAAELTYVEPFFQSILGARSVASMDVSNYENATYIHDLNQPIPAELHQKFDTVFDAGSLEHILNFPTAIRSLMQAVKTGGSIFIQTPANNYFGHGFYQFSAELFYRVFSAENGFQVERMIAFEHFYPCHFFAASWYEVKDPEQVRSRVQLVNNRPLLLMVHARKVADREIFAKTPQQSDYIPVWQNQSAAPPKSPFAFLQSAKHLLYRLPLKLVGSLFLQYLGNRSNKPALSNRNFFKKVK